MFQRQGIGRFFWILWFACFSLFHPYLSNALAQPRKSPYEKEESQIPKTPSAPPSLQLQGPTDTFQCERYFKYKGKTFTCDSNIRLDGEELRPIIQSVPGAVAELDTYQHNRLMARKAAYVGAAGLAVAITGSLVSISYKENGQATDTSTAVRNVSVMVGGGILLVSFLSALSLIKTNEQHLENAVIRYNNAHPEAPIELLFTTGIKF